MRYQTLLRNMHSQQSVCARGVSVCQQVTNGVVSPCAMSTDSQVTQEMDKRGRKAPLTGVQKITSAYRRCQLLQRPGRGELLDFARQLAKWRGAVQNGQRTDQHIVHGGGQSGAESDQRFCVGKAVVQQLEQALLWRIRTEHCR